MAQASTSLRISHVQDTTLCSLRAQTPPCGLRKVCGYRQSKHTTCAATCPAGGSWDTSIEQHQAVCLNHKSLHFLSFRLFYIFTINEKTKQGNHGEGEATPLPLVRHSVHPCYQAAFRCACACLLRGDAALYRVCNRTTQGPAARDRCQEAHRGQADIGEWVQTHCGLVGVRLRQGRSTVVSPRGPRVLPDPTRPWRRIIGNDSPRSDVASGLRCGGGPVGYVLSMLPSHDPWVLSPGRIACAIGHRGPDGASGCSVTCAT